MTRRAVLSIVGATPPSAGAPPAETSAAVSANIAVAMRFFRELLTNGDLSAISEIVAEDYSPNDPALADGREALQVRLAQTRAGIDALAPRAVWHVVDAFGAGDKVAVRWEITGDSKAGVNVTIPGMSIMHVAMGRIAVHWTEFDAASLAAQAARATASR